MKDFLPPPFITYAIPFFFLLMLVEWLIGKYKKESYYRFSDSISDLSTGVISQIAGVFLKLLTLGAYFWIYENYRLTTITSTSILGWVIAIVLWDFLYYWNHRLSHEVNIFWAAHVVHHHSEEYNLIVALRQTSTGGFLGWIFYVPMAFLGIDPWLYLAAGQINLIYQYWVHTRSVKSIGTIGEFLLSTPSHHRVHHAVNPEYIDKNHGGIFIIWDRIFGTFQKEDAVPVYGTVKPLQSFNPVFANLHYYSDLLTASWKAERFIDKFKVWVMPPGWYPESKNSPSGFLPIPEVDHKTFQKYDPEITPSSRLYALIWFIVILILSFGFIVFNSKMNWEPKISSSIWIVMSLVSVNGILENKSWSKKLEWFRILTTPFFIWHVFHIYL